MSSSLFQYYNYLTSVASTIIYYPILVVLPIGIIGNVFAFIIYTRPNLNKKTNTGFLYAWLCVFNLVFILYFVFVNQSTSLFKYTISLPCGVLNYLMRVISCLVPWMQVIISFDRFIAVVYPLKKSIMAKKWVLCLIMLGTFALISVANMANMLTYPVTSPRSTTCYQTNDVIVATNVLAILFRCYIPFGIMLALDIIVFKCVRRSRRRVGVTQMGQRRQSGQISNKEYNFIISTILIDLTFVLFYTPIAAHMSITVADVYLNWDPITGRGINIFLSCALLLSYLYSIVMIFIFFIFNRYFRSEFFALLRLHKIFPYLNKTLIENGSIINVNQTTV